MANEKSDDVVVEDVTEELEGKSNDDVAVVVVGKREGVDVRVAEKGDIVVGAVKSDGFVAVDSDVCWPRVKGCENRLEVSIAPFCSFISSAFRFGAGGSECVAVSHKNGFGSGAELKDC